jgi:hypothetical protein
MASSLARSDNAGITTEQIVNDMMLGPIHPHLVNSTHVSSYVPNFAPMLSAVSATDDRLFASFYPNRELTNIYITPYSHIYYSILATKRIFDIQAKHSNISPDQADFIDFMNRTFQDNTLPVDPIIVPYIEALGAARPLDTTFGPVIPKLPSGPELDLTAARHHTMPGLYVARLPSFPAMFRACTSVQNEIAAVNYAGYWLEMDLWTQQTANANVNIGVFNAGNRMFRYQCITPGLTFRSKKPDNHERFRSDRFRPTMTFVPNDQNIDSWLQLTNLRTNQNWFSELIKIMTIRLSFISRGTTTTLDRIPLDLGHSKIVNLFQNTNAMQTIYNEARAVNPPPPRPPPVPAPAAEVVANYNIALTAYNTGRPLQLFNDLIAQYSANDAEARQKFETHLFTYTANGREKDIPAVSFHNSLTSLTNSECIVEYAARRTNCQYHESDYRTGYFFNNQYLTTTIANNHRHALKRVCANPRLVLTRAELPPLL